MNMKENIEDLKMDKKTFKKLSKGSAYNDIYEPMVNVALAVASDLEKSEALLDEAEVRADEAEVRADNAEAKVKEAEAEVKEAKAEVKEAKAEAKASKNLVNEAREIQNECKNAIKLLDDEIKFKTGQTESARKGVSEADDEFARSMAENLHLKAENRDIEKATVNSDNEEFVKAFEGFKKSRIDENNRQMRLNKETASKMRNVSVDRRVEAEGYERRINFLKEQRNKALIAYAEACLNMELGE